MTMGTLSILGIVFAAAFAVVVLLKLWESELSISFTSKRINRGRKRRGTFEVEEDNLLDDGNEDEEANVRRTKRLKG